MKQWKPAAEGYQHAARVLGAQPGELALIAAHDWDINGARKAGLVTGYLTRKQPVGSAAMTWPGASGTTLNEAARQLLGLT